MTLFNDWFLVNDLSTALLFTYIHLDRQRSNSSGPFSISFHHYSRFLRKAVVFLFKRWVGRGSTTWCQILFIVVLNHPLLKYLPALTLVGKDSDNRLFSSVPPKKYNLFYTTNKKEQRILKTWFTDGRSPKVWSNFLFNGCSFKSHVWWIVRAALTRFWTLLLTLPYCKWHSAASSRHQDPVCVLLTSGCRQETVRAKAFH